MTYGVQNVATNFAYMDREYFTEGYGLNQIASFVMGFANGASQFTVLKEGKFGTRFPTSLFSYFMDYSINTIFTTDYGPFEYYDKEKKLGIYSLKAFVFTF